MTRGFAVAAVNGWLDGTYSTLYIKIHVGDPGASGANNAAAGDTTRKQATMASASGGSKAMTSMSGPWTNGGTSETLSDLSFWSAVSAGTFNGSGALNTPQPWASTNTFALTSLTIAITPIAA